MSHIPYDIYKDMLERGYELGTSDCYTTIRDALELAYGIVIPNYARPENFDIPELNLFAKIPPPYHLHNQFFSISRCSPSNMAMYFSLLSLMILLAISSL